MLSDKLVKRLHPALGKSLEELDKWAPKSTAKKPPGLRNAPADAMMACESCAFFNGKLGSTWKGIGECSKFHQEVKERQVCNQFEGR
jgi:hypothetical protein